MKHLQKPEESSLCGQTCVAMIAGISLEESINAFGTRGGTRTKDVVRALTKLGVKCGNKLIKLRSDVQKTEVCISKLHFSTGKHTHWTVWNKNCFFDPGLPHLIGKYPEHLVKETSFLPIFTEEDEEDI